MFQLSLCSQSLMLDYCIQYMDSENVIGRKERRRLNRFLVPRGILITSGRKRRGDEDSLEIFLEIRSFHRQKTAVLETALSRFCHKRMVCSLPEQMILPGFHRLSFSEECHFHILFAKEHKSKDGERISAVCGNTDDDRTVLVAAVYERGRKQDVEYD